MAECRRGRKVRQHLTASDPPIVSTEGRALAMMVSPDPDSKTNARESLVQWLAEHEDHEHNALPPATAHPLVQDASDRKLEGWADEILQLPAVAEALSCQRHGKLTALAAELAYWRCCGSPSLCGATCMDDELSHVLAQAERAVRKAVEESAA